MELYQEILCRVLANENIQVSFPELIHTDVTEIVELECYKALGKMKAILEDDTLADSECFQRNSAGGYLGLFLRLTGQGVDSMIPLY